MSVKYPNSWRLTTLRERTADELALLVQGEEAVPELLAFLDSPEAHLRELTWVPLIAGTMLGVVFGASSLYLVLKVGLTVSASIPVAVISITLFRLLWPAAIVTDERGTFKSFAKKSMQASFALPSTGGAVNETLSASPTLPFTAFFLARGWAAS